MAVYAKEETMTITGEVRETTANIISLTGDTGREGPQWKVQLRWPWTPAANKGGDMIWVNRADFPTWDVDTKGPIPVEVVAEYVKKGVNKETGEPWKGELDWQWRWRILRILDHAPAPAASGGNGGGRPEEEHRRSKDQMTWEGAWDNATSIVAAMMLRDPGLFPVADSEDTEHTEAAMFGCIRSLAAKHYQHRIAGPPLEHAQDGAQEAIKAPPGAETPTTPPQGQEPAPGPLAPRQQIRRVYQDYHPDAKELEYYVNHLSNGAGTDALSEDDALAVCTVVAQGRLPEVVAGLKAEAERAKKQKTEMEEGIG